MPRLLLDAQGVVLASAADAGDGGRDGLHGLGSLRPGASATGWLSRRATEGDAGAAAAAAALHAVLAGQLDAADAGDGACRVRVQACVPATPVAAILSFGACAGADAERARLTRALEVAESRLSTVQDAAGLGSWTVDAADRVARYSPQTYRLLRRDPARGPLPAHELRERAHPDDLPAMLAARERLRLGSAHESVRFRLRCDDGAERWLEARLTQEFDANRRPTGVVGTVRDVSDVMQAQIELERHRARLEDLVVARTVALAEASQRAEAAGQARDSFMSEASHELRTPLNVIIGLAHLMRRNLPDEATNGRVLAIERAARHLGAIVDRTLDPQRRDAPERPLLQPIDPAVLLGAVGESLAPAAEARGLRLQLHVEPSPLNLQGDADRVRQLVAAVVGWAIASALRGPVELSAEVVLSLADQATLRLHCVAAVAALPVPLSSDPDLAALVSLADPLGAQLQMHRDEQGRAHARVEIPVHAQLRGVTAPDAVQDVLAPLRQRHGGRRVLVAEDDPVNQLALLELLADAGLVVDTADDGRAAVDQAAMRPYALILMDLRMPRLDGLAAARAIRALPSQQSVPLIAFSANSFDDDRQACRAAGMDDFLPKPIDVRRLYELLLHWLDRGASPGIGAATARMPAPPAAPADADEAWADLVGLEGIDAPGGLASVGGKLAVYRRLLRAFDTAHAADMDRLHDALDRFDVAQAMALAHRIRGSAATLGLVDVETCAGELEHALESGGRAAAAAGPLARFGDALATTLSLLRTTRQV